MKVEKDICVNSSSFPTMIHFWDLICSIIGRRFLVDQLKIRFLYYNDEGRKRTIAEEIFWTSYGGMLNSFIPICGKDYGTFKRTEKIHISEKRCSCSSPSECIYEEPKAIWLYNDHRLVTVLSSLNNLKAEEAIAVFWLITFQFQQNGQNPTSRKFLGDVAQEGNWVYRMLFPDNPYIPDLGEYVKKAKIKKQIVFS